VKAAFTRAYNKENRVNPYAQLDSISKGRASSFGDIGVEGEGEDEVAEEDGEEDDEDVSKDTMIKVSVMRRSSIVQMTMVWFWRRYQPSNLLNFFF
jgi:hypothetical protein